jgi:intracellular multiplication protein IcmK
MKAIFYCTTSWRSKLSLKIALLTITYLCMPIGNAADPAEQALQQLKILQQKVGSSNSGSQGSGGSLNVLPSANKKDASMAINALNGAGGTAIPTAPSVGLSAQSTAGIEEKTVVPDEDIIEEKAFKALGKQVFPLNPDEIIRLKQMYHTSEFAQTSSAGTPPKPTATSQFVNLSPGSTPPVIRLAQGFVSSLVFLDSTGAPWPITAYDLGDPSSFNIQWDKSGNTLMIQAMKLYNYGNLAVRLQGLNTPVMLTLIPGQKAVDYRVDLRIQGYGPNASQLPMEEGVPPSANDVLLHVLDGVPPQGSLRLTISGGDATAWIWQNKMYVRTSLTILSPGWVSSMTSADGTHAYEMQKSPVLLVSWHGKVMQLKVEGL